MRESVSRPGPQCLQSQPHNGQPGSGTPCGTLYGGRNSEGKAPSTAEVLGKGKYPGELGQKASGLPALKWLAGSLHCTMQTISVA